MRLLDLFSGIGGFSLAAQWVWGDELEIISFCEIDPFCQKVLKKHWPNVPIEPDIKEMNGEKYRPIDIVCGGFPCTQTSTISAIKSKRKGLDGKDSGLWWEYLRIVQEVGPLWVVVENTPGVLRWANTIEIGLERIGYRVSRLQRSALDCGAPHLRRRVFFVANALQQRWEKGQGVRITPSNAPLHPWFTAPRGDWIETRTRNHRMDNGIPNRVDRIKALGNAVVPQVCYEILHFIKMIDEAAR